MQFEQPIDRTNFAPEALGENAAATASKAQATARLIEYGHGRRFALPPHTTYGLIEHPEIVVVPGAAAYAYGLTTWQNERIPILHMEALLHTEPSIHQTDTPRYALIVAYQNKAKQPITFGAIGLSQLPQTITVGNEAQCSLPDDSKILQLLALACFQHEGHATPILDTAKLFCGDYGLALKRQNTQNVFAEEFQVQIGQSSVDHAKEEK